MVDAVRRVIAEANRVRRDDPALARRLDVAAFRLAPLPEAGAGLMRYGFAAGTLAGPVGRTSPITLNADGTTVAAGTDDGSLLLWDRSDPQNPRRQVLDGPDGGVHGVALNPDGTILAARGGRNVLLVDTRDPTRRRILAADAPSAVAGTGGSGEAGGVSSMAFGPFGNVLAVAGIGHDVQIFTDVEANSTGGSSTPRRLPHPDTVLSVSFSRDGQTLATGGRDGVIRLWSLAGAGEPRVLRGGGPVTDLALSPFGDSVVSGHEDGAVRQWDLVRGGSFLLLDGRDGAVAGVDFSDSPEVVAAGSRNGTVRLWHLADAGASIILLPGEGSEGTDGDGGGDRGGVAVFSLDGRTLAAGAGGEGARLWNLDPISIVDHLCAAGDTELSAEEWNRHVVGVGFRPSCP
jgi:WD40 repeat protein